MTAAELRAAEDRYQRALIELRDARAAYVEAERLIGLSVAGLDALDHRKAVTR